MARKRSKASYNNPKPTDHAKGTGKGDCVTKQNKLLAIFHEFPKLPSELRLMIIEEALREDENSRPARVILFDHNTYRISPLVEQSKDLSPLLFVNTQFRNVALKIYVILEVIDVDVPYVGEFGDAENWHNEDGELKYNLDIAKMIDAEAHNHGEGYNGVKGHVYIRPSTDIFLTGLVPRQISETFIFSYHLDNGPDERWSAPICHITGCLPLAACAQISIIRSLVWDPGCPGCGEYHPIHCRACFLEGRGTDLIEPAYDAVAYPNVKDFGIYVMGGNKDPEGLMYTLAVGEHPTQEFLMEMDDRYVAGFPVPA